MHKIFILLHIVLLSTMVYGQQGKKQIIEIEQFVSHFQNANFLFFQSKAAKDSIIFLLNNKPKLADISKNKIDTQKILFNRKLLSLELFFSEDEIQTYAFDNIYRNVAFLKKIYSQYLNYPEKTINSFSSQESVALMYQVELYLYFSSQSIYIKNIKSLLDYVNILYSRKWK